MLGLPKLLPKESTIAEFLPSASTFLNTFVSGCVSSLSVRQVEVFSKDGIITLNDWIITNWNALITLRHALS